MIVCQCTGVTDAKIRETIRKGASTIAEVTRKCGAGSCCQSCHPLIARILYAATRPSPAPSATERDQPAIA